MNNTTTDPDVRRFHRELKRRQPIYPSLLRLKGEPKTVLPSSVSMSYDEPVDPLTHLERVAKWRAGAYDDQPLGTRT